MGMSKAIDRHKELETSVFPVRVPLIHLREISAIAKKADQTKGAVIREAIRVYLERKGA
jgi:predicted transcriptional regulator